jgi:hypothetical protein
MRKKIALLALLLVALCSKANAQATIVSGTVADPAGYAYTGANMTMTSGGVLVPPSFNVSSTGAFSVRLAPGTYTFSASFQGVPLPVGTGPQTCVAANQVISGATQTVTFTCPALTNITAGGGTPASPNQSVQINNNGVFGSDTWIIDTTGAIFTQDSLGAVANNIAIEMANVATTISLALGVESRNGGDAYFGASNSSGSSINFKTGSGLQIENASGGAAISVESDDTNGAATPTGVAGTATETDSTGSGVFVSAINGSILVGGTNVAGDTFIGTYSAIGDSSSGGAATEVSGFKADVQASTLATVATGLHVEGIVGGVSSAGVLIDSQGGRRAIVTASGDPSTLGNLTATSIVGLGATGGSEGSGTVNATGLYINGVAVAASSFSTNGTPNSLQTGLNFLNNAGVAGGISPSNPSGNQESFALANVVGGGASMLSATLTSPQSGDIISVNGSGVVVNQTPGFTFNNQTAAYGWLSTDRGKWIQNTSASGVIDTIPQDGSAGFAGGYFARVANFAAAGTLTLKATTSTVNGVAGATGIPIPEGQWCDVGNPTSGSWIAACSPGLLTAGSNITLTSTAYGTSIATSSAYNTAHAAGTSSISATTMITSAAATALYEFNFYIDETVAGTSCVGNTTVAVNAIWTDPNASTATTLTVGTFTISTNGTVGNSLAGSPVQIAAKASTAIQFSTTYTAGTGCSSSPTVQLYPALRSL